MTLELACYLFFIQNVRLTKDFFDHYLVSVMGFLLIPLDGVIWGLKPIEKIYQKLSDRDSFPVEKANWGKQERRECYYYLRLHNCPPPEAQRCRAENEVRRPVPTCCPSPTSSWMTHCTLLPFLLYFPGTRTEIVSSGEATVYRRETPEQDDDSVGSECMVWERSQTKVTTRGFCSWPCYAPHAACDHSKLPLTSPTSPWNWR